MREFRYINLGDDIQRAVLPELEQDTWLIFPTERSCREALSNFQKHWQPIRIHFLSIDEFKTRVIYSSNILLQDEKRLICLYQAMTEADRLMFHLEKYPDIVDWGDHFFQFFKDLAEECVDADSLLTRMQNNEFSYQAWQMENLQRMLAIRKQYYAFITAKGYSDVIFDNTADNIRLPKNVKRFVFVNQYYYSRLELAIIEKLEAIKRQVIIIYQGSPEWLDEETLKSKELDLNTAFPNDKLPFNLKVYQCPSLWQMALAFLKQYPANEQETNRQHFLIDAKFAQQPYHKAFNRDVFDYPEPQAIHRTRLCHFFQIMAKGLENLVTIENRRMVKTDWMLQAIGMKEFVQYFRPTWNNVQKEKFTSILYKCSENDVLYLDLDLDLLKIERYDSFDADAVALLKEIMNLLKRLSKVTSIAALIDVVDSENGIVINRLLSKEELSSSNLLESFYEALANFMSMDLLALVEDWRLLYPFAEVSAGIFDLFLTFIKPKTYRFFTQTGSKPAISVTNLMDTRNLKAEKVTFLNLVEGELPSSRTPVWLFNEKQRQSIGLKGWDDIRRWERYYFYRIIASAQEVVVYSIYNQDKDVEPSSFLNELCLLAEQKGCIKEEYWQDLCVPADTLLVNWLKTEEGNAIAERMVDIKTLNPAYLSIPCDNAEDFGSKQEINFSWSSCEHFIKNPFMYYLQDFTMLRPKVLRLEETLNRKMFGTLLHKYLNVINSRMAEQNDGILSMKWEWINREFLQNNLKTALNEPLLFYQIPRNYNWEYLKELLTPFLINTASWFFHVELAQDEDLQDKFIKLIPETDSLTDKERKYKTLIGKDENEQGITFGIRGKADLRLETDEKCFIIDFKTGDSDKLQLLFYMWTYYLIEQPELSQNIRAGIYKLMDKELNWLDDRKTADPALLKERILQSLDKLVCDGFAPATDAKQRRYLIDISRADLIKGLSFEEEEE